MEILFCDICNESVPLGDLREGRAQTLNGRVVCASCELAMGGSHRASHGVLDAGAGPGASALVRPVTADSAGGPRAEVLAVPATVGARASGGAAGVLVGLVALAVAGGGTWLVVERVDELARREEAASIAMRSELEATRRARAGFVAELGDELARARKAAEQQDALAIARIESLETLAGDARTLAEQREADARREVEALRIRLEEVGAGAERERAEAAKRIAQLEFDVRFFRDRMIAVEENLRTVGSATPGVAAGAPAEQAAPVAATWERYLPDLASPEDGIRVEAVIALAETRDARTVKHILPLLKDSSLFVRMVAAEAVGQLGDLTAVPALIDALEDERPAVREQAWFALQTLTGESLRFESNAPENERAKRVREWRDWWQKNRQRLAG